MGELSRIYYRIRLEACTIWGLLAYTVADLYARARDPKSLDWLPYDQTGLYVDPGMTKAHQVAGTFFRKHLGETNY